MPDDINTVFKEAEFDYHALGELYIEIIREGKDPKGKPLFLIIPFYQHDTFKRQKYSSGKVGTKKRYYKKYGYPFDIDKTGKEYPWNITGRQKGEWFLRQSL